MYGMAEISKVHGSDTLWSLDILESRYFRYFAAFDAAMVFGVIRDRSLDGSLSCFSTSSKSCEGEVVRIIKEGAAFNKTCKPDIDISKRTEKNIFFQHLIDTGTSSLVLNTYLLTLSLVGWGWWSAFYHFYVFRIPSLSAFPLGRGLC